MLKEKNMNEFQNDIIKISRNLIFNSNNFKLVGSSSLKNIYYYSDLDFSSRIIKKINVEKSFYEFRKILDYVNTNKNIYFIEFKIETINNIKKKWGVNDKINYNDFTEVFRNINFAKLDIIIQENSDFLEVSFIYFFKTINKNFKKEIIDSFKKEIIEYTNEKQYYKVLKRKFSLYNFYKKALKNNEYNNYIKELIKYFNENGLLYKKKSNLMTLELLRENYKDDITLHKIKINLTNLGFKNLHKIPQYIDELSHELNISAKKINSKFLF